MKTTASLAALAVAAALVSTPVFAADLMIIDDETMSMATGGFNWDGFYAGIGGSALTSAGVNVGFIDVIAGVNVTADSVLFGAEVFASAWWSDVATNGYSLGGEGRVGYLVTPDVLIYGAAGLIWNNNLTAAVTFQEATVGGGLEFAVHDNMSLDLEYKYRHNLSGGAHAHSVSGSLLWHF